MMRTPRKPLADALFHTELCHTLDCLSERGDERGTEGDSVNVRDPDRAMPVPRGALTSGREGSCVPHAALPNLQRAHVAQLLYAIRRRHVEGCLHAVIDALVHGNVGGFRHGHVEVQLGRVLQRVQRLPHARLPHAALPHAGLPVNAGGRTDATRRLTQRRWGRETRRRPNGREATHQTADPQTDVCHGFSSVSDSRPSGIVADFMLLLQVPPWSQTELCHTLDCLPKRKGERTRHGRSGQLVSQRHAR